MGKVIGGMEAGKSFAEDSNSDYARQMYNSMVPQTNDMIKQHNDLILYIFAGNATILSKLLIEPYSYI